MKEPYNLFADAGSTLPGGTMYEDLLVILKAVILDNGGTLEVSQANLMYVDRDEMLRVDDVFIDGQIRKVFSIQTKERNQNPEGCVKHEDLDDAPTKNTPLGVKIAAALIWFSVIFAALFLTAQIFRAVMF
jgi:hypothetical protein